MQDLTQYCSVNKNPVRPELVEGFELRSWWFDKLTTNGLSEQYWVRSQYCSVSLFLHKFFSVAQAAEEGVVARSLPEHYVRQCDCGLHRANGAA